ncbi:hypothetical protein BCF46_0805 [Litoreibacter meonggei]|uniref:Uncharacterized protein n=1 Tax=Litoreibacter meonggei TaxID=1049199 RepID=A0A497X5X6_9RHOB|nr:hypothetical protein [Litoreibacter meonggei]RLJ60602.1 hypothetical protein BCF46_0805 [Litoreibacter meonggei]
MKTLLALALALTIANVGWAATLSYDGVTVTVPTPRGYKDVSAAKGAPEDVAVFETRAVEELERAGEFNDTIVAYVARADAQAGSGTEAEFDEMFRLFFGKAQAHVKGQRFTVPKQAKSARWVQAVFGYSSGMKNVRTITATENGPRSKALQLVTGLVMPGVTTIPVVEEISFVLVGDALVTFHTVRADLDGRMGKRVRQSSARLRREIAKAAR